MPIYLRKRVCLARDSCCCPIPTERANALARFPRVVRCAKPAIPAGSRGIPIYQQKQKKSKKVLPDLRPIYLRVCDIAAGRPTVCFLARRGAYLSCWAARPGPSTTTPARTARRATRPIWRGRCGRDAPSSAARRALRAALRPRGIGRGLHCGPRRVTPKGWSLGGSGKLLRPPEARTQIDNRTRMQSAAQAAPRRGPRPRPADCRRCRNTPPQRANKRCHATRKAADCARTRPIQTRRHCEAYLPGKGDKQRRIRHPLAGDNLFPKSKLGVLKARSGALPLPRVRR